MSEVTRRPLPSLPIELKKEILRFCDQDTLAKAARASFAFLELASSLLYKHIEIKGPERLRKLFTLVRDHRQSNLDSHVDLSIINSLTYVDDPNWPFKLGKAPSTPRLPLQFLRIHLGQGWSSTAIFPLFDPVICIVSGVKTPLNFTRHDDDPEVSTFPGDPNRIDARGWTRVREISFSDAITTTTIDSFVADATDQIHLSYEFSAPEVIPQNAFEWMYDCFAEAKGDLPRLDEVVVHVRTQAQRDAFLEEFTGSVLLPRISVLVQPPAGNASLSG